MSPSSAPINGFELDGLYLAAVLMCAADNKDTGSMLKAIQAYAPASVTEFPETPPYPQSYVIKTEFDVIVVVAGTQKAITWVYNVLGSSQGPNPGVPGSVDVWFYSAAVTLTNRMQADILAGLGGRTITYIGHSLGGAIVQIMYQLLLGQIPSLSQVFTFGCPRVGDPVFAAAFGINRLFRVENLDDPIPSLPPVLWAAVGSHYPIPGLPPIAVYTNGGVGKTLNYQGYLQDAETPLATVAIVNALNGTQPVVAHSSAEYVRRLGLQLPVFDSGEGADFEVVNAAITTTVDPSDWRSLSMPNPLVGTSKVEVFYSFQGDGFSEVWYSNQTPQNLVQTIIPQYVLTRLTLATQGVQALYARVSIVGKPRQVLFWAPGFAYTPAMLGQIKGGTSGSAQSLVPKAYMGTYNGFDVQPQQALLVRLLNASNFWTRMFLHGFPAEVITGGMYTPTPNFALQFGLFIAYLKSAGSSWIAVYTTPNQLQNRVSIQSITANPGRGATVMYTTPALPPPGWPPTVGSVVTIGGSGATEVGMNGRKVVTALVGNPPAGQGGFVIGGASPIGAGPQVGQAYFYLDQLVTATLQDGQIERLTTHKVGKPVFEPVGRRRNTLALRR
jgi:pimeloyl-ACP methyl ester carboxylesterase